MMMMWYEVYKIHILDCDNMYQENKYHMAYSKTVAYNFGHDVYECRYLYCMLIAYYFECVHLHYNLIHNNHMVHN